MFSKQISKIVRQVRQGPLGAQPRSGPMIPPAHFLEHGLCGRSGGHLARKHRGRGRRAAGVVVASCGSLQRLVGAWEGHRGIRGSSVHALGCRPSEAAAQLLSRGRRYYWRSGFEAAGIPTRKHGTRQALSPVVGGVGESRLPGTTTAKITNEEIPGGPCNQRTVACSEPGSRVGMPKKEQLHGRSCAPGSGGGSWRPIQSSAPPDATQQRQTTTRTHGHGARDAGKSPPRTDGAGSILTKACVS